MPPRSFKPYYTMTYTEWLTKTGARVNMNADDVELILTNQAALIPNPNATVDVRTAKLALCNEFAAILPMANVSEGGYSITWNMDAVKIWYNAMCKELGIENVLERKPKVKGHSDIW